jgi:hypothetical protein
MSYLSISPSANFSNQGAFASKMVIDRRTRYIRHLGDLAHFEVIPPLPAKRRFRRAENGFTGLFWGTFSS